MTEERMALAELLQKSGDGDFLRSVAEALTRSPARLGISEGATTTHSCPVADTWRWMP